MLTPLLGFDRAPARTVLAEQQENDMATLYVVATIVARPGQEKTVEQALLAMLEPTRQEDGIIAYHLHRDLASPTRFIMIEEYRDQSVFKSHVASPHFQQLKDKLGSITEKLEITQLERLG